MRSKSLGHFLAISMLVFALTATGVVAAQRQATVAVPLDRPVLQEDPMPTPAPTEAPLDVTIQPKSRDILSTVAQILVTSSLAGFFPISAAVYLSIRRPVRREHLRQYFDLLGTDVDAHIAHYDLYHRWPNYALFVTLPVLLAIVGVSLLFMKSAEPTIPRFIVNVNTLQAMRYGFLGAYLFSAQLIYRRYTTWDLQPSVYMSCAVTLVAGMAFNYTAFEAVAKMVGDPSTPTRGAGAGAIAIIAFALGYFPSLAIKWFDKVAHGALGMRQRHANALPLGLIDGLSQLHESRLGDNGIDNVENLASADIPELLLNTAFGAEQVIGWVDQAMLYLYLEEKSIENFRLGMVRTLSDFQAQWKPYYYNPEDGSRQMGPDDQERTEKASELQSSPGRLDMLYKSTEHGPNAHHLANYWQSLRAQAQRVKKEATRLAARRRRMEREARLELTATFGGLSREERARVPAEVIDRVSGVIDTFEEEIGEELTFQAVDDLLNLAAFHEASRRYDQAIEAYEEAITIAPDNADVYNELAWLYLDALKDEAYYLDALDLAAKAVRISEALDAYATVDIVTFLDTLATAQTRLGMLDEAHKSLLKAKSLAEMDAAAQEYIELHLKEIEDLRAKRHAAEADNQGLGDSAPSEEVPQTSRDN